MNHFMRLCATTLSLAFVFTAGAQPAGEYITISPAGAGTATWQASALAWLVVLDPNLGVGQPISITVEGHHASGQPNPGITDLRIAANAVGTQLLLTVANIHHIDRLYTVSATSPDTIIVSAELDVFLGQPGSGPAVDVDQIQYFKVIGGAQNEIICSGDIFYFEVGSNLYGDLTIGGNLQELFVGRRIAADSSGNLVNYDIGGSIGYMEAGEIHASITVGSGGSGGAGRVSTIKATTGGGANFGNFSGDFNGSLTAVDLRELGPLWDRSLIQVLGDLNADLLFKQEIADDNNADPVIEVAGVLTGQIVINASNSNNDWEGAVKVGSTTLGPGLTGTSEAPYYGVLSSTIGGGAIGLVPFMFHADESVPAHNSVVTSGGFTGNVTIEHYGPVALDPEESGPPMQVYELSLLVPWGNPPPTPTSTAICEGDWTDVTSNYSFSISGRVVTVNGTFSNWKAYQFIPVQLDCNISDTPKVLYAEGWQGTFKQTGGVCTGMVATRGYGFQLKSGLGLFDLNDDEAIDDADIDAWLASPVDFNGDGNECLIDLAILIGVVADSSAE